LRDFLLVWDWETPQGKPQDQKEYKTLTKTYGQALEYSKPEFGDYLDEATRLWNDITILDDLGEYEKADERLEARSGYVTAFRKEYLPRLNSQYGRTLLSFVAGEGHEDIVKRLLETVDPDLKDRKSGRTPLSCATAHGNETVIKLLLENGKVDADSQDKNGLTPLSCAALHGHEAVVKLLLETGNVDADSNDENGRMPLWWATEHGHDPIVKLLLGKVHAVKTLWWDTEDGHESLVNLLETYV
jgi:ankyrin repeat protein